MIQQLTDDQIDAVAGGRGLAGLAGFVLGHIGGKLIDALDRALTGPNNTFIMTPEMEAIAAGNMTASAAGVGGDTSSGDSGSESSDDDEGTETALS